ncbi:hypothetical protein PIB30_096776 [Stylosanthes scabra]|uniref:Uncharacterized protein n=1 Tax=Stylosanthes scabra TaxID=79078 RepID=A0ABU6UWW5_9FABA|nr:hypothetical protein [Stylosanthes scabra]
MHGKLTQVTLPESRLAEPKRDQDSSKPKSATHRRRSPCICVGSQQLTFEAYVGRAKRDSILASPVQSHAYAQNSKHMRGRQAQCPSSPRPTSLNVHAFKIHIQPILEVIHNHEWLILFED